MAVFKCKMCGGDLNIDADINVVECEYCGTTQTVPTADNEKKMSLFARANKLRAACDFDKAAGVYESIVTEFPEEAEAYWGLILCKYGIEYVDDPATGKKVPTCHRSSFDCILDDSDFEMVMENADSVARKVYRDEAKAIEELRKAIIEISGKEEPYDIFICYKETAENGDRTIDSVIAQDVYDELTAKGYRVFFSRITLEDKLGQEYESYIFAALNSAKVMLAFGTDYEYYNAVWVKNEWSRFLQLISKGEKKTLIPCYKNIDAYDMPKEFAKLQAQDMGKVGAVQDLLRGIEKIIPKNEPAQVKETVVVNNGGPNVQALLTRGNNALEDFSFDEAKTHFDKVLDIDAECAEAYLGLAMAEIKISNIRDFIFFGVLDDKNYIRAKQYADTALMDKLTTLEKSAEEIRIEKEKAAEEERLRKKKAAEEERLRKKKAAEEERLRKEKAAEEERLRKEKATAEAIVRLAPIREKNSKVANIVSAGRIFTVGLKSDGTVDLANHDMFGSSKILELKNIVAVDAGYDHMVGLKSDGTVVAAGSKAYGACKVSEWKNIVAVAAGSSHTVGLKSDRTVVAVGDNENKQCNVSDWTNIVAVAAGCSYTVGLKSDGTVVAVGRNINKQCNVSDWTNIVAVAASGYHTVGLKSDGTVVAVGQNEDGQCNVSDWTNIVAVAAGRSHSVGLKSDGTVVAVGFDRSGQCNVFEWKNIVAVAAGDYHTVGLKSDGTVVAVGMNDEGQCNVTQWKLFENIENLDKEREEKRRQKAEYRAQGVCQHCGGALKGLFTKKCVSCGKEKDY